MLKDSSAPRRAASLQIRREIGATRLRAKRSGEVPPKPEGRRRKRRTAW
jgi:hypothetical protein